MTEDRSVYRALEAEAEANVRKAKFYKTLEEKVKSGQYINAVLPNTFHKGIKSFRGFQMMFEKIAKMRLNGLDSSVFLFMLARLSYENWISITQEEIAQHLDVKRPQVARSIKNLVNRGIISVEKVGRQNYYRLNPEVAWKGKAKQWSTVVDIKTFKAKQDEMYADQRPF